MESVNIEQLTVMNSQRLNELSDLLVQVVVNGASIGFLPHLLKSDAKTYWQTVLAPDVLLFVATYQQKIVGSIQLHLSSKPNGKHRAEIAKLMTHPQFRRHGIGRKLMDMAEESARKEGRTLIVLDTREGDPSNHLYRNLGYIQAGRIPQYATSANGERHATIFYYKLIDK
ncbi:GNAT family N-acetyltransferase [Bacillus timonensis]|nr:GNAT family N-acetyltransferase [Bacillus timonensis]